MTFDARFVGRRKRASLGGGLCFLFQRWWMLPSYRHVQHNAAGDGERHTLTEELFNKPCVPTAVAAR